MLAIKFEGRPARVVVRPWCWAPWACFSVSIMMLLTLNVGQAVHEKIRIQQLADASAFSMAVQEARVFNFMAYTNRANIGSLVSAASLHSYMSMASSIPEMFQAAFYAFFMHAALEFAICFMCCWPFCFANCQALLSRHPGPAGGLQLLRFGRGLPRRGQRPR